MSAAEKLKALEASEESPATDMLIVWDALPQIVAIVEEAETLRGPDIGWGPFPELRAALSALDEALG